MANTPQPLYILIGDGNPNGANISGGPDNTNHPTPEIKETTGTGVPAPAFGQAVNAWTKALNTPELWKSVPSDASGYPGPTPPFYPWWDSSIENPTDIRFSGTASGGSSTTLVDTGSGWTANQWSVAITNVRILSGTGSGQVRTIASNTIDTLTVTPDWTTPPDATSVYQIEGKGGFVVYHHLNSNLNTGLYAAGGAFGALAVPVPGAYGDNHYSQAEGGFGCTISLMQALRKSPRHAAAPYFRFWKQVAGFSGFKIYGAVGSAQWATLVTQWHKTRRLLTYFGPGTATGGSTTTLVRAATTGTATGGTATTITGTGWTAGAFANLRCRITGGTGSGQSRRVTGNSTTVATVTPAWTTVPDGTSTYSFEFEVDEHVSRKLWAVSGPGVGQEATVTANTTTTLTVTAVGVAFASGTVFRLNDTEAVQAVVLDCAHQDIIDSFTNFPVVTTAADVLAVIDKLRDAAGDFKVPTTTPIVLLMPHPGIRKSTAEPFTIGVRDILRGIVGQRPNILLQDWNGLQLGGAGPADEPNPVGYAPTAHIDMGYRLGQQIEAWFAEAPTETDDYAGLPAYIVVGDSTGVGSLNASTLNTAVEASMLGPYYDPYTGAASNQYRVKQWVFNASTGQVERYSPIVNDNTQGTVTSWFGPSATMLKRLAEQHPDGVMLIKLAQNGAALTKESAEFLGAPTNCFDPAAADNHLDAMRLQFYQVAAALPTEAGGVPFAPGTRKPRFLDLRGFVFELGDNDCGRTLAGVELGEVFAAKIGPAIENVRRYFTTRIESDEDLAVAIVRPKKHLDDDPTGSTHGTAISRRAMRAAIESLPSQYPRVAYVNVDDLELERVPTGISIVHHGLQMQLTLGYRIADALIGLGTLIGGAGAGADSGSGDGAGDLIDEEASQLDGSATFVVEDGTGVANANSYTTVAFADQYHANMTVPAVWEAATTDIKEKALRVGTDWLDTRYGTWWTGIQLTDTQGLLWPRAVAYDRAGRLIEGIHVALQRSTALMALRYLEDPSSLGMDQTGGTSSVTSESFQIGPIHESKSYSNGGSTEVVRFQVERMLRAAGLLESGSFARR